MRRGSGLVNVSRGRSVVDDELAASLREGHLAFAALDVREHEPPLVDDPLRMKPNTLLTPHTAWVAAASHRAYHEEAAQVSIQLLRRRPLVLTAPSRLRAHCGRVAGRPLKRRGGRDSGSASSARAEGPIAPPSGSPSSTIRPRSMYTSRCPDERAKPISWVTTIIVWPWRASSRHHLEHLAGQLRVERRGDLVEQDDLGLHRERSGDGNALLLAARQLRRVVIAAVEEADAVEQAFRVHDRLCRGRCRTWTGASMTFSSAVRCGNRLYDWNTMPSLRRRIASAPGGPPGPRPAAVDDRLAVDLDPPAVDLHEADEAAQQRRLARAACPDDDEDLAAGDVEVDAVEDALVP